jgi:hypothetical protein
MVYGRRGSEGLVNVSYLLFDVLPWYSLLIWSHEQENNYNIHNEKDIKTNENYEMFTID